LGGTLASAFLASAASGLPTDSAFCKRCISKLETEIVAITIVHGMTGEIR
jgi:hypothetical protein